MTPQADTMRELRSNALCSLIRGVRDATDLVAVAQMAIRILGEILTVDRVAYASCGNAMAGAAVECEWRSTESLPSLASRLSKSWRSCDDPLDARSKLELWAGGADFSGPALLAGLVVEDDGVTRRFVLLDSDFLAGLAGDDLHFVRSVVTFVRSEFGHLRRAARHRAIEAASHADRRTLEQRLSALEAQRASQEAADIHARKMEALGQITAGIAHDFNNLLGSILGAVELIRARSARTEMSDIGQGLRLAESTALRAAALTRRLLAFSRRQSVGAEAFDVRDLVSSMMDLFVCSAGPSVEVSMSSAENLWPAMADVVQVESALLNLVINARDAMPSGGALSITASNVPRSNDDSGLPSGDFVALAVTDTGMGMSSEVLEKALLPFFTTKPQGTGLGLATIDNFVRRANGRLRVTTAPGDGTTVEMLLPRGDSLPAAARHGQPPSRRPLPGNATLLLVEDNADLLTVTTLLLNDLGYVVLTASSASDALAIAASDQVIDVLVTDIGLRGGDGRRLAEQVRSLRPTIPILFVTGDEDKADFVARADSSRIGVILKPASGNSLGASIAELMRRPA